jgi:hypothetical protein
MPTTSTPVSEALRQSPIPALRRLKITETADAFVLSGTVASYYLKQLAQETIMPMLGNRRLDNQVEVVRVDGTDDD